MIDFDWDNRGGCTVLRDGHPQSYVDLADPGLLVFEYVQYLALVVDTLPAGRLAVTHVGGAGLSVARYIEYTRPGSPQIVLEPDATLTARVREEIPLPRRHRIRVRPVDGATGITELADATAHVVVVDAFDEGRVPGDLAGSLFVGHLARVLKPGDGLAAINVCDEPGLRHTRRVLATLAVSFARLGVIAPTEVLKGRRFGNVVLIATDGDLAEAAISRRVAGSDFPTSFLGDRATRRMIAGAAPFGDIAERSPAPPKAGSWRLR